MNESASIVAGFRDPALLPPVPSTPTLTAKAVKAGEIELTWGVVECSGILVERSSSKLAWSEIGSTAGATTYLDNSVSPNVVYNYRVRAYNEDSLTRLRSYSSYSNTASARSPRR
jgi:hypothetical protein